jgi:two-component system NtrC family sensor kinase
MPKKCILLAITDPNLAALLEKSVLAPVGYDVVLVDEPNTLQTLVKTNPPDLVLISEQFKEASGLELAKGMLKINPSLPAILLASKYNETLLRQSLSIGLSDCLGPPVRSNDVLQAIENSLARKRAILEWSALQSRRNTNTLQKRLDTLEALQRLGHSMTSSLDLDQVLTSVVDAAVELSGAEEGSLLLLDDNTGELYMRAARKFDEEFVRTFRLPVHDSLPGKVLRTGKPLTLDEKIPQKIKTSYLVHSLIYVPLKIHGRVIGVLGVDNRKSGSPFPEEHLALMTALADYAAVAIGNARLYADTANELEKLETILTNIDDGVIVASLDNRLIMVNPTARKVFNLGDANLTGWPVQDVIQHPDLLDLFDENKTHPTRSEIILDDGRTFNAQTALIPEVGLVVTIHDITYLKELDRIKTDFVNTVSHDLRSPLTAILGYVELFDRVGKINDQQREFIRRIQYSVNNITALINDLLDLGRVEAGFDTRKEIVHLPAIIQYAVEGLRSRITEKEQVITLDVPTDLPTTLGNPQRLRQMIGNLVNNAVKFTPNQGKISVQAHEEDGQIIIQVSDNGPGIPLADQPYIFDKFYRGSNVSYDTPGTGLGLAIVKSIVENHQGRIWLNSTPEQGTTFTVVLPTSEASF